MKFDLFDVVLRYLSSLRTFPCAVVKNSGAIQQPSSYMQALARANLETRQRHHAQSLPTRSQFRLRSISALLKIKNHIHLFADNDAIGARQRWRDVHNQSSISSAACCEHRARENRVSGPALTLHLLQTRATCDDTRPDPAHVPAARPRRGTPPSPSRRR